MCLQTNVISSTLCRCTYADLAVYMFCVKNTRDVCDIYTSLMTGAMRLFKNFECRCYFSIALAMQQNMAKRPTQLSDYQE